MDSLNKSKRITPRALLVTENKDPSKILNLEKVKHLLELGTLESHQQVFKLLQTYGVVAFQRWEEIHSSQKSHLFSTSSSRLANDFAHMVLVHLNDQSRVLELGCGYGNDALFIGAQTGSRILAVDGSQTAINEAKKRAKMENFQVDFRCEDYVDSLAEFKGKGLDMIYCYSAAHFWPARLFQDILLPVIAQALSPSGVFCLAMETAHSASAKRKDNISINSTASEDEPYLYLIDKESNLFKMYPKTKEVLISALAQYFEVIYEEIVEVEDYEKVGEAEVFVCVIAKSKLNLTAASDDLK